MEVEPWTGRHIRIWRPWLLHDSKQKVLHDPNPSGNPAMTCVPTSEPAEELSEPCLSTVAAGGATTDSDIRYSASIWTALAMAKANVASSDDLTPNLVSLDGLTTANSSGLSGKKTVMSSHQAEVTHHHLHRRGLSSPRGEECSPVDVSLHYACDTSSGGTNSGTLSRDCSDTEGNGEGSNNIGLSLKQAKWMRQIYPGGILQEGSIMWVLQLVTMEKKEAMLTDLRQIEAILESIFEAIHLDVATLATRRSLNPEVRDALNFVLGPGSLYTDQNFFQVAHARHCLFPVMQHCTDNGVLRDAMFLDIALDRIQQELALQLLAVVFPVTSPTSCSSRSRDAQCSVQDMMLYREDIVPNAKPRQHAELLSLGGNSSSSSSSLSAVTPLLSSPTSPNRTLSPYSPSTTSLSYMSPIYLLKEVLGCLVGSLLALHLEFPTIDSLHADMTTLIGHAKISGYGVQSSMQRLRDTTFVSASVESTQFARGFYQTQMHGRGRKKYCRLSATPGPGRITSPFIIPSLVEFRVETSAVSSSQLPLPNHLATPLEKFRHETQVKTPPPSSQQPSAGCVPSRSLDLGITTTGSLSSLGQLASGSSGPVPTSALALRQASIAQLRQQAKESVATHEAFVFMRSLVERLQRLLVRTLSILEREFLPKTNQLTNNSTTNRSTGTGGESLEENDAAQTAGFSENCMSSNGAGLSQIPSNQHLDMRWMQEAHAVERILLESPINATAHVTHVLQVYLNAILGLKSSWQVLYCSVYRQTGVFRYVKDIRHFTSSSSSRPTVLVVSQLSDQDSVPPNVSAVLFPGTLMHLPNDLSFYEVPCSLSPLVLSARRNTTLLAASTDTSLWAALLCAKECLEGREVEVTTKLSQRALRISVFDDFHNDVAVLDEQHAMSSSQQMSSSSSSSSSSLSKTAAEVLSEVGLLHWASRPAMSASPIYYMSNVSRAREATKAGLSSTWLIDLEDLSSSFLGPMCEGLKDLMTNISLGPSIAPTVTVPWDAFDRALAAVENREKASCLARLSLQLQQIDSSDLSQTWQILQESRCLVQTLLPPFDFQLEYENAKKIAAICRGTKKASVLRRIGRGNGLEFWHCITAVWSSLYTPATYHHSVKSGVPHSSLRVAVLIQDVRSLDYSFSMQAGISTSSLKRLLCHRTNLVKDCARRAKEMSYSQQANPPTAHQTGTSMSSSPKLASGIKYKSDDLILKHIVHYWDAWSHASLEDIESSVSRLSVNDVAPENVTYLEISPGVALKHSEILSSGRIGHGIPLSLVAVENRVETIDNISLNHMPGKSQEMDYEHRGSSNRSISLSQRHEMSVSRRSGYNRTTSPKNSFNSSSTTIADSPNSSTKLDHQKPVVTDRRREQRNEARHLLSFPSSSAAMRFKRSGLLFRGDIISYPPSSCDSHNGGMLLSKPGALIITTTTGLPTRVEYSWLPLVCDVSFRDRLIDRLLCLRQLVHSVTREKSWFLEGGVSSGGHITISGYRPFNCVASGGPSR